MVESGLIVAVLYDDTKCFNCFVMEKDLNDTYGRKCCGMACYNLSCKLTNSTGMLVAPING